MDDLDDILQVLNGIQEEIDEVAADAAGGAGAGAGAAAAGADDGGGAGDQEMPDKKRGTQSSPAGGQQGRKRQRTGAAFSRFAACRMEEKKQALLRNAVQVRDSLPPQTKF
jgi:hypothetical protein